MQTHNSHFSNSAEMQTHAMGKECQSVFNSFLHFLTYWCWIEDKVHHCAIPFLLWPSQRIIIPLIRIHNRLVILKARQLGLTWLTAAYSIWICITQPLQLVVVISAKEEWALEFLERVKFILQRLPPWLCPSVTKETAQSIEFSHANNLISTIKSLTTTEEGAQSKTPTLLVLDETARNRYVKSIWNSSKPGLDAGGGKVIVISNAIKDGVGWPWTRDLYTDSMKGGNDFVRVFLPWNAHPQRPADFLELQAKQGMDELGILDHYPSTEIEALTTHAGSYFSTLLQYHTPTPPTFEGHIHRDTHTHSPLLLPKPKILSIWEYPYYLSEDWDGYHYHNRYAIGSDISEGLGGTYSVAYVIDRLVGKVVARLRSNLIDAYIWGELLFLLSEYYGTGIIQNQEEEGKMGMGIPGMDVTTHLEYDRGTMICAERTGAGQTTVKRLRELRARQYIKPRPDITGKMSKVFGWGQTRNTKHELMGDCKNWIRDHTPDFNCSYNPIPCGVFLSEATTFIRHENGDIRHEDGKMDDAVLALALTTQVDLTLGKPPTRYQKSIFTTQKQQDSLQKVIQEEWRGILSTLNTEDKEGMLVAGGNRENNLQY